MGNSYGKRECACGGKRSSCGFAAHAHRKSAQHQTWMSTVEALHGFYPAFYFGFVSTRTLVTYATMQEIRFACGCVRRVNKEGGALTHKNSGSESCKHVLFSWFRQRHRWHQLGETA